MPTNVCYELFTEIDEDITAHATGAVVGKTFAAISGPLPNPLDITSTALPTTYDPGNIQVATCGAGLKAVGVFAYDQVSGGTVPLKRGKVVPVTAGANITAGQEVQSDAAGKAIPLASGKALGIAWDSALSGADALISLYP